MSSLKNVTRIYVKLNLIMSSTKIQSTGVLMYVNYTCNVYTGVPEIKQNFMERIVIYFTKQPIPPTCG